MRDPILDEHNRIHDRIREAREMAQAGRDPEPPIRALWEAIANVQKAPERETPPHWKALENIGGIRCEEFMFMGVTPNGTQYGFKNIRTRRYIFITNV